MTDRPASLCRRCGGPIPDAEHAGEYPGALSRYDNETEICSSCGQKEAICQLFVSRTLPDLDHEIVIGGM